MRFRRFVPALAAAVLGLGLATTAALAVEATARVALNVREDASASSRIVDTLSAGERVDVRYCTRDSTWCYINHTGPDGWVSARYLDRRAEAPVPSIGGGPSVNFGIYIGPGGIGIGVGQPPSFFGGRGGACFYSANNYGGSSFCVREGGRYNHLGAWNDRISSVRIYGGARARLCRNTNLGGFCRTVTSSERRLGVLLNDEVSSLRVY